MQKTVVLNVVGLTPGLIGPNTPFLSQWSAQAKMLNIKPVLPAVTCSVQATYLTGQNPDVHGIVGNGWYFRDTAEVRLWHQSNALVEAPKIWDVAKAQNPDFTCANLFWWYNMYSTVDYSITPRPQYFADGRKAPDIYTHPANFRDYLQQKLGTFPLFNFWGPRADITCSRWIAASAKETELRYNPTLTLVYLPHLDYNFQRLGNDPVGTAKDLQEIDAVCADLIGFYEARGAQVILLSEYGITTVNQPVHLNRVLRKHGYLTLREERGFELLDAGASQAFALADHQVAHIYVHDKTKIEAVKTLLAAQPGVEAVWGEAEKVAHGIKHPRAGELVAIAKPEAWFTYYYWEDDDKAPDFARIVEIHKKPGYDPVELFADPSISLLPLHVVFKLLKKKLGFRMLMDIIPLDATLVKGSHGRYPSSPTDGPLLISKQARYLPQNQIDAKDVFTILLKHLFGPTTE